VYAVCCMLWMLCMLIHALNSVYRFSVRELVFPLLQTLQQLPFPLLVVLIEEALSGQGFVLLTSRFYCRNIRGGSRASVITNRLLLLIVISQFPVPAWGQGLPVRLRA
jgi:hypothetical protein